MPRQSARHFVAYAQGLRQWGQKNGFALEVSLLLYGVVAYCHVFLAFGLWWQHALGTEVIAGGPSYAGVPLVLLAVELCVCGIASLPLGVHWLFNTGIFGMWRVVLGNFQTCIVTLVLLMGAVLMKPVLETGTSPHSAFVVCGPFVVLGCLSVLKRICVQQQFSHQCGLFFVLGTTTVVLAASRIDGVAPDVSWTVVAGSAMATMAAWTYWEVCCYRELLLNEGTHEPLVEQPLPYPSFLYLNPRLRPTHVGCISLAVKTTTSILVSCAGFVLSSLLQRNAFHPFATPPAIDDGGHAEVMMLLVLTSLAMVVFAPAGILLVTGLLHDAFVQYLKSCTSEAIGEMCDHNDV
mmetsp:Transcript_2931/g.6648  ORF Transcript_2931/g.6648 Transcript_2931/m.6648 type:complete len:350 (+) Transcript_2931:101-1150(+)